MCVGLREREREACGREAGVAVPVSVCSNRRKYSYVRNRKVEKMMGGRRKEWPLENFPSSESRTCVLQVKNNTHVFAWLLFYEQICHWASVSLDISSDITSPSLSGNSWRLIKSAEEFIWKNSWFKEHVFRDEQTSPELRDSLNTSQWMFLYCWCCLAMKCTSTSHFWVDISQEMFFSFYIPQWK